VILENIKKKYCARLIDDFDFAIETADNQLGNAGVSCDVTRSGYSWLSAVFGIRSSLLENPPRRIAERVLFC